MTPNYTNVAMTSAGTPSGGHLLVLFAGAIRRAGPGQSRSQDSPSVIRLGPISGLQSHLRIGTLAEEVLKKYLVPDTTK